MRAIQKEDLIALGCDEKLAEDYQSVFDDYWEAEYEMLEARKRRYPSYNDRFNTECLRESRRLHEYYEPRLNDALLIALDRLTVDGTMH